MHFCETVEETVERSMRLHMNNAMVKWTKSVHYFMKLNFDLFHVTSSCWHMQQNLTLNVFNLSMISELLRTSEIIKYVL